MGSKRAYDRIRNDGRVDAISEDMRTFLAERDSFYMASVSETGWPYIQHRGGSKGFVRVLDERTIAFADQRGNKQYVSLGNVSGNDRMALIFVDYPHQARLKMLAHAVIVTRASDPALFARVARPGDESDDGVERVFVLHVEALDWNCPQYITRRFTEEEVRELAQPLFEKISTLEAENAELRSKLAERR